MCFDVLPSVSRGSSCLLRLIRRIVRPSLVVDEISAPRLDPNVLLATGVSWAAWLSAVWLSNAKGVDVMGGGATGVSDDDVGMAIAVPGVLCNSGGSNFPGLL